MTLSVRSEQATSPSSLEKNKKYPDTAYEYSWDTSLDQWGVISDTPRWVEVKKVSQGGMADFFTARDVHLERTVGMKIARSQEAVAPEILADQLLKEAWALAKINSPYIIHVDNLALLGDEVAVVMEWIPPTRGITLRDFVANSATARAVEQRRQSGHFFPELVANSQETENQTQAGKYRYLRSIISTLCQGAHVLCQAGHAHNDIKPENVFLTPEGVRLIDLGIAQGVASQEEFVGTMPYMSPERTKRKPNQAFNPHDFEKSEMFSIAVTLYELLAKKQLFSTAWVEGYRKLGPSGKVEIKPLRTLEVHNWALRHALQAVGMNEEQIEQVGSVLDKALSEDPSQRYDSILDFSRELQASLH